MTKKAYDNGLVLTLDWCVYPYTYGLCCCCRDCCVPTRMRLDYGLKVAMTRTHAPKLTGGCKANAITLAGSPVFDQEKCLGCGQCSYVCPEKAIEMQRVGPIFSREEFSTLRLGFNSVFFAVLVFPGLLLYTLFNRVFLRKYPRDEFTELGADAHGPFSVHETPA